MSVEKNYVEILSKIEEAKARSPYNQEVALVVVTKTIELPTVEKVIALGAKYLAENRVQEIQRKYDDFGRKDGLQLHLIGSLQTNKVKYIMGKVDLIHSLDRHELAAEIQKQATKHQKVQRCLIQAKISEEESKKGMQVEDILAFAKEVKQQYPSIEVCGLMGMAPYFEDPQESRSYFKKLRTLFEEIVESQIFGESFNILSMGMSNDYEIAIEEGATMVRIGSAIFTEN